MSIFILKREIGLGSKVGEKFEGNPCNQVSKAIPPSEARRKIFEVLDLFNLFYKKIKNVKLFHIHIKNVKFSVSLQAYTTALAVIHKTCSIQNSSTAENDGEF